MPDLLSLPSELLCAVAIKLSHGDLENLTATCRDIHNHKKLSKKSSKKTASSLVPSDYDHPAVDPNTSNKNKPRVALRHKLKADSFKSYLSPPAEKAASLTQIEVIEQIRIVK